MSVILIGRDCGHDQWGPIRTLDSRTHLFACAVCGSAIVAQSSESLPPEWQSVALVLVLWMVVLIAATTSDGPRQDADRLRNSGGGGEQWVAPTAR
jgi:hypothetical protein